MLASADVLNLNIYYQQVLRFVRASYHSEEHMPPFPSFSKISSVRVYNLYQEEYD